MALIITQNTQIESEFLSVPVKKAMETLKRDIYNSCISTEKEGCRIVLKLKCIEKEMYYIFPEKGKNQLTLQAGDEMGFIYGIYEISRRILGVHNFWFWNDQKIEKKEEHRKQYTRTYYGEKYFLKVSKTLEDYAEYAVPYGVHEDEHAGEQFANHVSRMLISQYMKLKKERSPHLLWATDAESLEGQIQWFQSICKNGVENYKKYLKECEQTLLEMADDERTQQLFRDTVLLHVKIHFYSYVGAELVCRSLLEGFVENYQKSFYYAGKAREAFLTGNDAMKAVEHGKWQGFYNNECLEDVKQCGWLLENLMGYIRNLSDGSHFYQWQRDFLYSEENKKVMLILVMENHLNDLEIFQLMKEKWDD